MLRMKRKPLTKLREWGKKMKLSKNTKFNEKPTEERPTEGGMVFSPPLNEPSSPVYLPTFSPLEESEEEEVIKEHM